MLYGILAAASALLLTAVLSATVRVPALRLGIAERRRGRRVPSLGGVAVLAGVGAVAWVGEWSGVAPLGEEAGRLIVVGAGLGVLGLVGDVWRLPAVVGAAGVVVAAALVVPYRDLGVLGGVAGVFWIALVVHGFKGMARSDGVLGVVGAVTAFALSGCAAAEVMDGLATLFSVLAAALTGFLMHNWPPARIVLGTCGALFVGFVLAGGVLHVYAVGYGAGVGAPFALTAVATADVVLALVSRRRAGRELWRGGPDHLAHRLRRIGLTPPGVVVVLGVCAAGSTGVGLAVHMLWTEPRFAWWVAGATAVVVLAMVFVPVGPPRPAPAAARPVPTGVHRPRPIPGGRAPGPPSRPRRLREQEAAELGRRGWAG
ncbi:undecaprenyl/decaprenyl-phosphate alpha-N-acetylglucosaminyl 1-phosphate transferase [Streptomyces phaeolivaceus]|uniref:Undecaprenyl/decaprenyl-phosphate alpha-N-acetylglucosaminyl 1-phosphate transferase n=1 Tax=Streptomyces phaeolivaceus TaxID=2653200 RepID=A0A5P8K7J1_9ACTN|nr:MraY family glycosyltransferase [Streptomyces phaeolivaceus]QFQ99081.1 undecaprenyl/decaprenyl-phosphate alpha-N-acetylglucosaminyl 1-phosphate transferase [Streptomyces phaeolivaceus]